MIQGAGDTWITALLCVHACDCVSLPQPVPGNRRLAGVGTRGCGAPAPSAAWRRGSISGSSAGASPFSLYRTLPPPAGHWLKWQRHRLHFNRPCTVPDKCYEHVTKWCSRDRYTSDKRSFRICWNTSWVIKWKFTLHEVDQQLCVLLRKNIQYTLHHI